MLRIIFLPGPIYDQELLREIRVGAFAYIHGHSAGGTNPSLLEALSTTDINILFNVEYNKEVGEKSTLYFSNKEGSLTKVINKLEQNKIIDRKKYGKMSKQRIKDEYTWDVVESKYRVLFNDLGDIDE